VFSSALVVTVYLANQVLLLLCLHSVVNFPVLIVDEW
jgi:hypothetical protein